jgi:hypothetical protein
MKTWTSTRIFQRSAINPRSLVRACSLVRSHLHLLPNASAHVCS